MEPFQHVNWAILSGVVACVCYASAAILIIRHLKETHPLHSGLILTLSSTGLLSHALQLWNVLWTPAGVQLGVTTVTSLFAFVLVASGVLVGSARRVYSLMAPAFPTAIFGITVSLLFKDHEPPMAHFGTALLSHILLSVSAYCMLALALSQAILLWAQNYQLRHHRIAGVMSALPPLQTMEAMLFDLIMIAMALLTLAIGTGFLFIDDFFAQHLAHKTVFALSAWVVLWILLLGRKLKGWRGMVAVNWTLAGFILLTLSYFGSKVALEIVLNRS